MEQRRHRRSIGNGPSLVSGDLWQLMKDYDAVGIPTNGEVNSWASAVMGAGVARDAARRWQPWLQEHLGASLIRYGNRVHVFENEDLEPKFIFSFPTKYKARDRFSDKELIARSCEQLMAKIEEMKWNRVIMPTPGTGMGRLSWSDVMATIKPILDDRVFITTGF